MPRPLTPDGTPNFALPRLAPQRLIGGGMEQPDLMQLTGVCGTTGARERLHSNPDRPSLRTTPEDGGNCSNRTTLPFRASARHFGRSFFDTNCSGC
jgi:hypothetical protein